jgi:hypothetical protein
MSNTWDIVAKKETSNKKVNYTKLPEGVTLLRILDDAPVARYTHWMPNAKRTITCPGKGKCPVCNIIAQAKANNQTSPYSSRQMFSLNVYNYNTKQVELLEQGRSFFEELLIIREDNGDVTGYDIKVRRRGMNKDTSYRLDVVKADNSINPKDYEGDKIKLDEIFKELTADEITALILGKSEVKNDDAPFDVDEIVLA